MTRPVRRGDVFEVGRLRVTVLEVFEAAGVADVLVTGATGSWPKRQPLPFPPYFRRIALALR